MCKYRIIYFIIFLSLSILFFSCDMDKEPNYTVTFNANGASGTPPPSMKAYEDPNSFLTFYTVRLPDKGDLYFEGKIFYGWNTKADGSGNQYFPYASEYSRKPEIKGNTTFYAQWIDAMFPPVQNLRLSIGDGFILEWDEIPGYSNLDDTSTHKYDGEQFISYIILRRATNAGMWTTNNFIPFACTATPSYRDTRFDISAGGTFEYIVALGLVTTPNTGEGSDYKIILGSHSNVSNSTVGAGFLGSGNFMPAPTMFDVAVNSATSVTLSWRRATNLSSNPCLGFYVFSNIVPPGTEIDGRNWVQENVFIPYDDWADYDTSFRHTYTKTVNPSTTYYFSVAAVYRDGRGELARPIMVTTPDPPITVTGVTATANSATSITVTWNENNEATAYKVYYEVGASTIKHEAETVAGTSFTHTGLTPDTEYRYSIRAISVDKESYQYSNTATCRTFAISSITDPIFLILTNNSFVPLKTIKINNGENRLESNLYKDASCQIQLNPGIYSVTVNDTEDRQNNFQIEIIDTDVRYTITDDNWPPARLTIRNNYGLAISSAYLRLLSTDSWGANRLSGSLTTNNTQVLGNFNQGLYEAYAESVQYYQVTSGTSVNGITITGGVIDGYRPVWYNIPSFTIATDMTLTFPANGWVINKPE